MKADVFRQGANPGGPESLLHCPTSSFSTAYLITKAATPPLPASPGWHLLDAQLSLEKATALHHQLTVLHSLQEGVDHHHFHYNRRPHHGRAQYLEGQYL